MPDKKQIFTYGIIAFIVLVIIYYFMTSAENFSDLLSNSPRSSPSSTAGSTAGSTLMQIPALYNRHTGDVITGSEFLGVPDEIATAWGAQFGENDNLNTNGPTSDGSEGLNYNMCSKSCCSAQYPPPFPLDDDVVVEQMKKDGKFVPSSYKCNNAWQDSGCVCMTPKQHDFLASRGNNAN